MAQSSDAEELSIIAKYDEIKRVVDHMMHDNIEESELNKSPS